MNFDDYKLAIAGALREVCPALASRVLEVSAADSCSDVLSVETALRRAEGLHPHVARCAASTIVPVTNAAFNRAAATMDYDTARLDALRCALSLTANELAAMTLDGRAR